jgi:hypothetical protein
VIATGFDAAPAVREPVAMPSQTPVDLQHYATHLQAKAEPQPAAEMPRMSIARRPSLDIAAAMPAAPKQGSEPGDVDLDSMSPFDVPAFLRREG